MKLEIEVHPFDTPNYVVAIMPPRPKQDGINFDGPKWKLSDLEPDALAKLCDEFRAEIFKKAGKEDPDKQK